jgi:hypothetical protein
MTRLKAQSEQDDRDLIKKEEELMMYREKIRSVQSDTTSYHIKYIT